MKLKANRKINRKKLAIALIVTIALLAATLFIFKFTLANNDNPKDDHAFDFDVDEKGRGVNKDKTDSEKEQISTIEETPSAKVERVNTDTPISPDQESDSGKKIANAMVTNTGQSIDYSTVDASGLITNIVESSGLCSFIFSKGDIEIKKLTDTIPNPNSTTCKSISFPSAELGKGVWNVSIEYESENYIAKSDPMELIVE